MFFNDLKQVHGKVFINETWCKGCGFCVQFCPTNVLDISSEFNAKGYHPPYAKSPEKCHYCMYCQMICPEFSIFVTRSDETEDETEKGVTPK
jgi:2-oxoglutarate ferredoxin oxidoreductase subunit delta